MNTFDLPNGFQHGSPSTFNLVIFLLLATQVVALYQGLSRSLVFEASTRIHWPNNANRPPLDVPFCGFTGDEPHCKQASGISVCLSSSEISCA